MYPITFIIGSYYVKRLILYKNMLLWHIPYVVFFRVKIKLRTKINEQIQN